MTGRNGQKKDNNVTADEKLVLSSDFNERMGSTIKIRVVVWRSGTKNYPQLEKREFYADRDTGEEKSGKAKGFTLKDLTTVVKPNWNAIMTALGSKLPEHQEATAGNNEALDDAISEAQAETKEDF